MEEQGSVCFVWRNTSPNANRTRAGQIWIFFNESDFIIQLLQILCLVLIEINYF